jgi:hypothetical protein
MVIRFEKIVEIPYSLRGGMAKYPQTALQRVKKKLDTNMHYD